MRRPTRRSLGVCLLTSVLLPAVAAPQSPLATVLAELYALQAKVGDADTRVRVAALHRVWTLALASPDAEVKVIALGLLAERWRPGVPGRSHGSAAVVRREGKPGTGGAGPCAAGGGRDRGQPEAVNAASWEGRVGSMKAIARWSTVLVLLLGTGSGIPGIAGAQDVPAAPGDELVLNGSFETPPVPGTLLNFAAGQTFGSWTVASGNVDLVRTIWTAADGAPLTAVLTLRPIGTKKVVLTPATVVGGTDAVGTVVLECPAGPDDVSVTVWSAKPGVAVPDVSTIVVPEGSSSGEFGVTTFPVAVPTKASIKARANDVTKAKALTVTPPAP
jgi:hypothetical protein